MIKKSETMKKLDFVFQTSPNFRGVTDEFEFTATDSDEAIEKIKDLWHGSGIQPDEGEAFLLLKIREDDNYNYIELGDLGEYTDKSYRFILNEEFFEYYPKNLFQKKDLRLDVVIAT
jgi:hypothetical protein